MPDAAKTRHGGPAGGAGDGPVPEANEPGQRPEVDRDRPTEVQSAHGAPEWRPDRPPVPPAPADFAAAAGPGHTRPVLRQSSGSRFAGLTGAFRAVAIVEAVSYLALLAAVVLYRVLGGPDLIGALGPVHGMAFLVYLVLALQIRDDQGWGLWTTIAVIVAAALPLGAVWAERKVT